MHFIDYYAYNNNLHKVDPAYKAILAFTQLLLCLLLDEPLVGLVAVAWMSYLTVKVAGIRWRVFRQIVLIEGSFMVFATMGVVLSVSHVNPGDVSLWALRMGPFWFSSSPAAIYEGIKIIARALGAATALNFLALTTPLVDLIELSRRWRVPGLLVDLAMLMYRFVFVLLDSLSAISKAQRSRLGYNTTYWRSLNSSALLGSRLFIDAFQRSRRLQTALEARGYEGGDFQVLAIPYQSDRRLLLYNAGIAGSLFVTWILG